MNVSWAALVVSALIAIWGLSTDSSLRIWLFLQSRTSRICGGLGTVLPSKILQQILPRATPDDLDVRFPADSNQISDIAPERFGPSGELAAGEIFWLPEMMLDGI